MPPEASAGMASRHAAPRAQRSALPFIVFSFVAQKGDRCRPVGVGSAEWGPAGRCGRGSSRSDGRSCSQSEAHEDPWGSAPAAGSQTGHASQCSSRHHLLSSPRLMPRGGSDRGMRVALPAGVRCSVRRVSGHSNHSRFTTDSQRETWEVRTGASCRWPGHGQRGSRRRALASPGARSA